MTYQNNMPIAETPQEQEAIDRFFQNLGPASCPQVEAVRREVQRHFDVLDAEDRAGVEFSDYLRSLVVDF
jgi:hypothetical protein